MNAVEDMNTTPHYLTDRRLMKIREEAGKEKVSDTFWELFMASVI